jgi:hypothetical protein
MCVEVQELCRQFWLGSGTSRFCYSARRPGRISRYLDTRFADGKQRGYAISEYVRVPRLDRCAVVNVSVVRGSAIAESEAARRCL